MDGKVGKITNIVIGIIILFSILAALYPTLTSSASSLQTSGAPLPSLYVTVIPLVLIAGVVLVLIYALMAKGKK